MTTELVLHGAARLFAGSDSHFFTVSGFDVFGHGTIEEEVDHVDDFVLVRLEEEEETKNEGRKEEDAVTEGVELHTVFLVTPPDRAGDGTRDDTSADGEGVHVVMGSLPSDLSPVDAEEVGGVDAGRPESLGGSTSNTVGAEHILLFRFLVFVCFIIFVNNTEHNKVQKL